MHPVLYLILVKAGQQNGHVHTSVHMHFVAPERLLRHLHLTPLRVGQGKNMHPTNLDTRRSQYKKKTCGHKAGWCMWQQRASP